MACTKELTQDKQDNVCGCIYNLVLIWERYPLPLSKLSDALLAPTCTNSGDKKSSV